MTLSVVCVRWGEKYNDDYVRRLQRAVTRFLSLPHEFVCLTNRSIDDVKCRALPSGLPNWWSKVGMFRPGALKGEKLYLDLDVIITGSLDLFIRDGDRTNVWALDDFSYSLRQPRTDIDPTTRALLGGDGTCNSSIMYWADDAGAEVWEKFRYSTINRLHGDQNHITQVLWPHTLQLYPPGVACSYKYDVLYGMGVKGSVICFHGEPKPHQLELDDPLRKQWQDQ